jgi:hypothetical protein
MLPSLTIVTLALHPIYGFLDSISTPFQPSETSKLDPYNTHEIRQSIYKKKA